MSENGTLCYILIKYKILDLSLWHRTLYNLLNVKLVRILISVCGDKLVSCNVGG